jgi:hypothetical protein
MYHDFKRRSGVSDEEIRQKDEAIRGVLVPYPVEWYLENLRSAGFHSIEIINAAPAFVTFFAIK